MIENDLPRPTELLDEHWSAICDGVDRIRRAQRDADWSAAVGGTKELCETVARIVLAARHAETGGDYPALIGSAHKTLDRLPGVGSAADRPVREMAQAARNLAVSLADLRNQYGTGHGRAVSAPTTSEHASLAVGAAVVWSRWALGRLDVVLANTVDRLIADLQGETFYRGALAGRLTLLDMATLPDDELVRLGRAVAHRGIHSETFVVREDGIDAVVTEPDRYPAAYRRGLITGMFVDANGYVRARPEDIALAHKLVDSLWDTTFLIEFSKAVEGADFSYAMNMVATMQIAALLGEVAKAVSDGRARDAWNRLKTKFATPGQL